MGRERTAAWPAGLCIGVPLSSINNAFTLPHMP